MTDQPGGNCEARISLLIKMRAAIAILLLVWGVERIYRITGIHPPLVTSHFENAFGFVDIMKSDPVPIVINYLNSYLGIILVFAGIFLLLRKPFATLIANIALLLATVFMLARLLYSQHLLIFDEMMRPAIYALATIAIYPVIVYLLVLLKKEEAIITREMDEQR